MSQADETTGVSPLDLPAVETAAARDRPGRRGILSSATATIGMGLILFWVVVALAAPYISPYPPNAQDFLAMGSPEPSWTHWLGTDILGRDILSRVMWGARTVLVVAPVSVACAMAIGIAMGLVAGYCGPIADAIVSRISDIVLAFPIIVLYLILIANVGPSVLNIIVATIVASAPGIGRIVRGLVLEFRTQDYVAAARLRGESAVFIMLVELLPNCRGPLIVDAALRVGYVTITIGLLGFIGLGLPPPNPDWGGMAKDGVAMINVWPHMAIFPCLAIISLVLGSNLLADGLRDLVDR